MMSSGSCDFPGYITLLYNSNCVTLIDLCDNHVQINAHVIDLYESRIQSIVSTDLYEILIQINVCLIDTYDIPIQINNRQ